VAFGNTYGMKDSLGCIKVIDTHVGSIAIGATDEGVATVDFLSSRASHWEFENSPKAAEHCENAVQWLKEYFAGSEKPFSFQLDLAGTDFQRAVWGQINSIGFGQTKTYGEIAIAIGKPMASRAVGAAVGANPVPLIIPCHRVLGANGKITGYSGGEGIPTKRLLLALEKIDYTE
jgi:methylated-DNA-[protein]-cysteine S-methyltransferase